MKKVIFCMHNFPGTGGGGAFNLIKYLPRYGYDPIVITNACHWGGVEQQVLHSHFPRGIKVYRAIGLPKSPFRVFSKFLGLSRVASFLDRLIFVPDIYITTLISATWIALRLLRTENIECIITSSPPESFQLIGLLVKKMTGCKWIAHLRDLWSSKEIVHRPATSLHAHIIRKLEEIVYENADHIVANTHGNAQIYQTTFNVSADRMTVIPNGYDVAEAPKLSVIDSGQPSPVFRVGYMGYFDKPGFPWQQLLAAVRKLSNDVSGNGIELHITGHVSAPARQAIERLGLSRMVRLHGELAHADAYAATAGCDLLVVLHYETGYSKAIVPHKLYHYLGMRKPILAVGESDGEMALIIKNTKVGRVVSATIPNGIYNELLRSYQAWKVESHIPYHGEQDKIEQYEVQKLTVKLAKTIARTARLRAIQSDASLRLPVFPPN